MHCPTHPTLASSITPGTLNRWDQICEPTASAHPPQHKGAGSQGRALARLQSECQPCPDCLGELEQASALTFLIPT